MPKKGPPRNAFFFYMKDLQPGLLREGRVFPNGMADVVPIAGPRWKALTQKERDRYENMAKDYKRRMKGLEGDNYKFDNVGNIIGQRKDRYEEMEKKRMKEREEVRSRWPHGKDLIHEHFYIVHFNTLCTTDDGICLPCEVGLVEYSMECGVKKMLHRFIDPGRIPSGYRYTCNEKSSSTHKIPVDRFELGDKNYRGLLIQLENFVNQDGQKDQYPPVYCKAKDIEETEMCLSFIHGQAGVGRPLRLWKVYELEGLVVDIYSHIGRNMSKSMVFDMLSTNIYDFNSKVQCEWHAEMDVKYCSLGIARRHSYVISDNLSDVYEFPLTKNHIPDRSNITDSISVVYEPKKLDLPTPRSSASTPHSFSQYTPRDTPLSYPIQSSATNSQRSSPYPARDYRYNSSGASSVNNGDDVMINIHSDTGGSTINTRSYTPNTREASSMQGLTISKPASFASGDTALLHSQATSQSSAAVWRRGGPSGEVSRGVGRGIPISQLKADNSYTIAKPGTFKSCFPLPRPPGMPIHRGRGFAPEKTVV